MKSLAKVGSIEFINSLPVDLGILNSKIRLNAQIVQGTPMQLNEKMLSGDLDISPISAFWYASHSEKFYLLPDLSISSESAVYSVLLVSRFTLAELKGKKIAITDKGSTTPALLKVLCRTRHGFDPDLTIASSDFGEIPQGFDAVLLIGDQALHAYESHKKDAGLHFIDLAKVWQETTQTPFVFALWAVRREFYDQYPDAVTAIYEGILRSRDWGKANSQEVLNKAFEKTELSRTVLQDYFSVLRYHFDDSLKNGLRIFLEYAAEYGLLKEAVVLEELPSLFKDHSQSSHSTLSCEEILGKALKGERVSIQEGVKLYYEASLHALGAVANEICERKNPNAATQATFVVDRNINYTNYCYTLCKFCAFYRLPGDKSEGYVRSQEEIRNKIQELLDIGGTQVLLQGGHNPELGIEYYEDLVTFVHTTFPQVHVHSFSASEIKHMSKISKISIDEVIARLKKAGLNSLPGGGAEILVDRVRQIVSPLKTTVKDYFEVHEAAHRAGLKSTSTMVYGLGETIEERMIHFDQYRTLQDRTGGFRAFIPWSFESESTQMLMPRRTGSEYLRMVALSRIMLDNIQHIQAGWVTEGPKLSQAALRFGADDFGGILMEENVVSATKSDKLYSGVDKAEAIRLISEIGKTPFQRNTNYEIVKVHSTPAQAVLA